MNKISRLLLMGALVCGLGLSVTSCKDDDEEKIDERIVTEDGKTYVPDSLLTDHERYQLACQSAVISTMRNLAGLESVTPDVVNETHEPTYGTTLDDAGATVRVMKCESTAAAELSFRAIAGLDSADAVRMYTPTADGYQLDLRNLPILPDGKTFTLGTLTFHRDGGPRRHGYVEVDIPCIPHLERIDYLSPEAFPDNAGTNSAYQLGDVVWVPASSGLCSGYYVCVATNGYRSTLVHMKRGVNPGDDVGINVDDDNAGCWIPYNNKHGHKTTFEDICDYVSFILMNQNKVANIKTFLEGKAYNMKPTVSGMLWHVFPEGFNNDMGVAFYNTWGGTGRIFYDGSITDDYAVIPAYNYRNAIYAKVPCGCNSSDQVTSDNKRYVTDKEWDHWMGYSEYTMNVIHTNSTVSGSKLEYSPLNDKLEMGVRAVNATKNDLGKCYADDGILYESRKQAQEYGHTPLGIVVYVNYGTEWGKEVTESDHNGGHGLVMAYKEKSKSSYSLWETPNEPYSEDYDYSGYLGRYFIDARNDINGYDKTQALEFAGVEAAERALNDWPEAPSQSSGWFIPTTGQWLAALNYGLGNSAAPYDYDLWTGSLPGSPVKTINNYTNRDNAATLGGHYWTSSAQGASASKGVFIYTNSSHTATFKSASSLTDNYVYLRPFLAF